MLMDRKIAQLKEAQKLYPDRAFLPAQPPRDYGRNEFLPAALEYLSNAIPVFLNRLCETDDVIHDAVNEISKLRYARCTPTTLYKFQCSIEADSIRHSAGLNYTLWLAYKHKNVKLAHLIEMVRCDEIKLPPLTCSVPKREIRKAIRIKHARRVEAWAIKLHLVHGREGGQPIVSNQTHEFRGEMLKQQDQFTKLNYLENIDTKEILGMTSTSDQRKKRAAEIYTRVLGLQIYASRLGLVPVFITATLPSEYHANPRTKDQGEWNGTMPWHATRDMQSRFKRFHDAMRKTTHQRILACKGIESHSDGCPHAHCVYFVAPMHARKLFGNYDKPKEERGMGLIDRYFGIVDARLIIKRGKSDATPASYVMKHIINSLLCSLDDSNLDENGELIDSRPRDDSARWLCRRRGYEIIDIPGSATAWRQIRAVKRGTQAHKELMRSAEGRAMWHAATGYYDEERRPNYADFLEHYIDLKEKDRDRFKIEYETRDSGTHKIVGFQLITTIKRAGCLIQETLRIITKTARYRIVSELDLMARKLLLNQAKVLVT